MKTKASSMRNLLFSSKTIRQQVFLSVSLLFVFIGFSIKLQVNEKSYNIERNHLITQYESKIDSLQINHIEFASKVFSWSVRSELIRNNTENLNQLLTVFVQESGADLVHLINPENQKILLSTNKKLEGSPYIGNLDLQIDNSVIKKVEGVVKIITPVMGFNNKIGILIVELKDK